LAMFGERLYDLHARILNEVHTPPTGPNCKHWPASATTAPSNKSPTSSRERPSRRLEQTAATAVTSSTPPRVALFAAPEASAFHTVAALPQKRERTRWAAQLHPCKAALWLRALRQPRGCVPLLNALCKGGDRAHSQPLPVLPQTARKEAHRPQDNAHLTRINHGMRVWGQ